MPSKVQIDLGGRAGEPDACAPARPYGEGSDNGDPSGSNKYRRWRQGKALPNSDSIAHMYSRSGGAVRLGYWKDLPLWELLTPVAPPISRLHRLLEQMPMNIRRHLFLDGEPDARGWFHHAWPEGARIRAIRNQASVEALITLLCLARKGEELEDDPQHYVPSACAFDLLPHVLYGNPALRYRWESLFACIERLFWNRIYYSGFHASFPIDTIREGLQALDADPKAVLPIMSGHTCREIQQAKTLCPALEEA
ncbi:hypothetical protein [Aerolutibacter ruishenii]|uniref:Uncharacterized protein n=1 Tax=Aerolutibacter ruishenii TaxID=686800 RepID=A0A562LGH4_9GAMM|nr:hypothetical protein [Lysobacter ruishenii]TWI06712.1 hypothetical protein IP93_02935 [Lysobacter ruishenii]